MTDDPATPSDTKLTRTKQSWARAGKFLTGRMSRSDNERLPPGQHLVKDWPVLDLGLQPKIALESWTLDVDGAVENRLHWRWADVMAQEQTQDVSDIHCVTTWSRYDNHWEGVSTRTLLDLAHPKPDAGFVVLHSHDGYTTNLTLEDFASEDAILAHSWEGRPIPTEHGGPLRLVLPKLYFWKSAKWLKRIEFTAVNQPGFWEQRGYHDRGDPWREERYSDD
ncbi:molybdopterin-binding protein [Bosea sp. AAP35]|uniref:sulfite oxidase-like oxidoreductase n=1 Tax=Bosea sp. AAP35 TaxID=1523417 RepID=UPI0006B8EDF2|nr:sulfite oxidase-like oxidoreductase [Bosea sp. AAP35]KPF65714.1 molybdopterin-binding protein [Bosea sp. AAP35]